MCQDPNAGARAAAKQRNAAKIANYKSNAVKWWNAEAIYDQKRKFINGDYGEEYKKPYYWAPFVYYGK